MAHRVALSLCRFDTSRRIRRIGAVLWRVAKVVPSAPVCAGLQCNLDAGCAAPRRIGSASVDARNSQSNSSATHACRRSDLGGARSRTARGAAAPRREHADTCGSAARLLRAGNADRLGPHLHLLGAGGATSTGQEGRRPLSAPILGSGSRRDAISDAAAPSKRKRSEQGPCSPDARSTLPNAWIRTAT